MNLTFNQEVYLLIIDKLILGTIIVVIAFIFNRLLDNYKNKRALETELSKKRVISIGEVWSIIYQLESDISQIIYRISDFSIENQNDREHLINLIKRYVDPLKESLDQKSEDIRVATDSQRFWLGEKLYNEFREYHNQLIEYMRAFEDYDYDKMVALKSQLKEQRLDAQKILKKVGYKL